MAASGRFYEFDHVAANGSICSARRAIPMSAAFSPITIDGALVLPDVSVGMIEASSIRRPAVP
jgi:hypothetical protein